MQTDLLAAAFRDAAVMAVGDPHQSIYGWRGASAGNLGGFAAAFSSSGEHRRRGRPCGGMVRRHARRPGTGRTEDHRCGALPQQEAHGPLRRRARASPH
ncbi:UvrD-helicase domain-containing protein, partial [Acinetobacter baumannii]|uniref:UvrD-helicase domain-containing protein n=1 Tax=Acinetobacter baumannii TaxID=470 RepID=UPI0034DB5DA0